MKTKWVAIVAAMVLFIACANKSVRKPDTINIAVPYEIDSLDPHSKTRLSNYAIASNFYDGLVATDASNKIQPRLASSWENPDVFTWIFHLQTGVTFHSGKRMRAEDVAYTFDRLLKDPNLEVRTYLTDVAQVNVQDDYTVKVRTKTPLAIFLNKLSNVVIVPKGATFRELDDKVDGTGPYKLREWKKGEAILMTRNEKYWGPKPQLAQANYYLGRDPDGAIKDVVSRKCQLTQYNFKKFESIVRSLGNYQVLHKDNYFLKYLSFDVLRDVTPYCKIHPNPFKSKMVRRAIHVGINRQALVEQLPTYALPSPQFVPPFVFGYNPAISLPRYDPAEARSLLSQAGLPNGFEVTLFVRQILQQTGMLLKDQLMKIGIKADLKVFPDQEFFQALDHGDFTFYLSRVGATVGDSSDILEPQLHSREPSKRYGVRNYGGYSNPEVDRAIEESAQILKVEERRDALEHIMAILIEDLPWVPLYIDEDVYALENSFAWNPRHDSNVFAYEITLK